MTNQQWWEKVKELDEYVRDNDVTDWELNFIGDLHGYIGKRGYTSKQQEHILRLWEKYCL